VTDRRASSACFAGRPATCFVSFFFVLVVLFVAPILRALVLRQRSL